MSPENIELGTTDHYNQKWAQRETGDRDGACVDHCLHSLLIVKCHTCIRLDIVNVIVCCMCISHAIRELWGDY